MPATATPPEPTGAASDQAEPPIDVAKIRATAERALQQGPVPRYADLKELEQLLRGHAQSLLPFAEAAVDALDRGSVEWYGQRTMLDTAHHHLGDGMGTGLVSASIHVRQLAHDTRALLAYAPEVDQ